MYEVFCYTQITVKTNKIWAVSNFFIYFISHNGCNEFSIWICDIKPSIGVEKKSIFEIQEVYIQLYEMFCRKE